MPLLTDERLLSSREIASRLYRSEDWVATRVREVRSAIAEQVLVNAGDELPDELRVRLEACVSRRSG